MQFHKKHGQEVIDKLQETIHISTYYNWLSGKSPIPIKFIRAFAKYDPNILAKCYNEMTYLSVSRKKCILPKSMTRKLAYLIGVLNGDGHMHKNRKYFTITVDSLDYIHKILLPHIRNLFECDGYINHFENYYRLDIGSKVIHSFLSLFCPVGKKTGKLYVPTLIKENKEFLKEYLCGLFDTDGCIGYGKKKKNLYFVFVQSDKKFVFEIHQCLISLGVHVNLPRKFMSPAKPYAKSRQLEEWRIYVGSKKDLKDLLNIIHFKHPNKIKKSREVKGELDGFGEIRTPDLLTQK